VWWGLRTARSEEISSPSFAAPALVPLPPAPASRSARHNAGRFLLNPPAQRILAFFFDGRSPPRPRARAWCVPGTRAAPPFAESLLLVRRAARMCALRCEVPRPPPLLGAGSPTRGPPPAAAPYLAFSLTVLPRNQADRTLRRRGACPVAPCSSRGRFSPVLLPPGCAPRLRRRWLPARIYQRPYSAKSGPIVGNDGFSTAAAHRSFLRFPCRLKAMPASCWTLACHPGHPSFSFHGETVSTHRKLFCGTFFPPRLSARLRPTPAELVCAARSSPFFSNVCFWAPPRARRESFPAEWLVGRCRIGPIYRLTFAVSRSVPHPTFRGFRHPSFVFL